MHSFQTFNHPRFSGELHKLCEEIETKLQESRSSQKYNCSVMKRRVEAWEDNRPAIFETVVKGDCIPE